MARRGNGAESILLVAALLVVVAVVIAVPGGAIADGTFLQDDGTQVSPDSVVIQVDIQPNGAARWQVEYRVVLDDANTSEAFEAVRQNVTEHSLTYAGRFRVRQEPAVAAAENATGREMALRNVTVAADRQRPAGLPDAYGVLTYTFEWTDFGTVENGRIRAGKALVGFFLHEDWTLIVSWPDGYRPVEVVPAPDGERDRTAVWRGPTEFTTGGPRVVLEPTGSADGLRLPTSPALLVGLAGLVVVLAVGWYRREGLRHVLPGSFGASDEAHESEPVASEGDAEPDATPPEELLSDEERVVRLLEEHGGRMKQQDVVGALEWSETKTSQVVRDLHEEEKIERYRLGRENVLALPGEMDI